MKHLMIFLMITLFVAAGLGYAQDCSKCPSKSKCGQVKLDEKKADVKVYISKTKKAAKLYHKKNACNIKEPVPMSLKKAVEKKYKPCPDCYPPKKKLKVKTKTT